MKIECKNNEIILKEVFNGISLETPSGNILRVNMSDNGFEMKFNNSYWHHIQREEDFNALNCIKLPIGFDASEIQITKLIEFYNKANERAPVTLGINDYNAPAEAWVDKLEYTNGIMYATLINVSAKVSNLFYDQKIGQVAGCYKFEDDNNVRLFSVGLQIIPPPDNSKEIKKEIKLPKVYTHDLIQAFDTGIGNHSTDNRDYCDCEECRIFRNNKKKQKKSLKDYILGNKMEAM